MSLDRVTNLVPNLTGDNTEDIENLRKALFDILRSRNKVSGTWIPTPTFVTPGNVALGVPTIQRGDYTLIGDDRVIIDFNYIGTITHTTAAGNLQMTGLPFISQSPTGYVSYGGMAFGGITKAGYTQVSPRVQVSTREVNFHASGSGVAPALVAFGDVPTGGTLVLRGSLIYKR